VRVSQFQHERERFAIVRVLVCEYCVICSSSDECRLSESEVQETTKLGDGSSLPSQFRNNTLSHIQAIISQSATLNRYNEKTTKDCFNFDQRKATSREIVL